MTQGIFITLEGGEGTGKTTQQSLLADALRAKGVEVVTTREPGGSPGAEDIRRLLVEGEVGRWTPMSETLLLFAARNDHLARTILPALEKGEWVVCDRFSDSTIAYQGGGMELGAGVVRELSKLVVGETAPDLTLILDLPVETGLQRAQTRATEENAKEAGNHIQRYERMDQAFHERMRGCFLEIAAQEPGRCVIIDAAGEVETVHEAIMAAVLERLETRIP
ncbi:MAG: dTMP kinase [Alphaproteobacteria bacterium]|nr:dTMP kinase [Alphaproteobacteria bacterium]